MRAWTEALEPRCLLAVTGTTPIPINPIEQAVFSGPVIHFTANDAGPFTAQIAWGDLAVSAATLIAPSPGGGFDVSGSHTYAEDGPYTITVTITDTADNTTAAGNSSAAVREAVLSLSGISASVPENSTALVPLATLGDPGSPDPASEFSATINWGNGVTNAGTITGSNGTYTISGNPPAFTDEGTAQVTITAFENNDPTFTISITDSVTITEADVLVNGLLTFPTGIVEGQVIPPTTQIATFSDTGFPTNVASDFTAQINWGDGTTAAGTVVALGGGNFGVQGGHTYAEEGNFTVSVTVADDPPGTATLTFSGPVTILNAPLTGSPVAIHGTEGAPLTNVDVATFIDADPLGDADDMVATINWGDGTTTAGTIVQDAQTPPGGGTSFHVQGSHTYTEERAVPFGVVVTIIDRGEPDAPLTGPLISTVTVNSTAAIVQSPLLPVSNSLVTTEGVPIPAGTQLATFTDTGGADPVGEYTATLNWGDGSGVHPAGVIALGQGNFAVVSNGPFTYTDEGIFALTITVTDNDAIDSGGVPTTAATTSTVTVKDAALTASQVQPVVPASGTLNEGQAFDGLVSTFTDANPGAGPADFVAIIDWGDGSPNSIGTVGVTPGAPVFTVSGHHVYQQEGVFHIIVVTTDDGGSRVTTTTTATVGDPALTGAVAIPVTAQEGRDTGPVPVARFIDPDPNSSAHDWNAVIDWGDGSPVEDGTIVLISGDPVSGGNIFRVLGSHTFTEEGPPPSTITVTITDVDNPLAPTTVLHPAVTVVDAPLTSQGASIQAVEGIATGSLLIATFTDANPFADVADFTTGAGSVTIDWGDGTSSTGADVTITSSGSPNGVVFKVNGSHTYAEEGSYQISVTVVDTGGSQTIAHGEADVADARLTRLLGQPVVNTTESPIFPVPVFGAPLFTGPVASFTDANPAAPVDDFRAIIDWGDGTPLSIGSISQPGGTGTAFLVNGSHTYADAGVNGGTGHYPITVYIADEGGSKLSIFNTANVADNPITVTGFLNPASDSGQSHFDAITNVAQPSFFGTSEPRSHVMLFATPTGGGPLIMLGQTQAASDGSWSIKSTTRLADGSYTVTVAARDQFGKTTSNIVTVLPNAAQGSLVIDTVGPRVTFAFFNRLNGEVDVVFRDERSGMNVATLIDAANYSLTKPHTQPATFLVTNLTPFLSPGNPTAPIPVSVVFNGGAPIKGGFYTFTIRDSSRGPSTVQDVAGNSLDGEFYGTFPSGNGIRGGDFVAMLDAIHNKIFAPQTVVGTANPANGGQGGLPVGAPHSGIFTPVLPRRPPLLPVIPVAVASKVTTAMAIKPTVQVTSSLTSSSKLPAGPRGHK